MKAQYAISQKFGTASRIATPSQIASAKALQATREASSESSTSPRTIDPAVKARLDAQFGTGSRILTAAQRAAARARIAAKSVPVQAGTSGALTVVETEGGYTYPSIPYQLEQGIPDYYRKSRASRGLTPLPPEAGQLARRIGRYVANMPNDPDNRGSIEATIAQVLIAAAQAAEQAGDGTNAARLGEIAGLWAKRVVAAGGQAPTIALDLDKPLAGMHYEYGFFHAPDAPVFSLGLTNHQLSSMAAVGVGIVYGKESKSISRGALYGLTAYAVTNVMLSVFRRRD